MYTVLNNTENRKELESLSMVLVTELIKNIISKRILNIEYSGSSKYYDLHTAVVILIFPA